VLLASVGGIETDAFQSQTQAYFRRWKAAGHAGRLIAMPGYNHFDVARTLCDPKGALVQAVLEAMQIKDANDA
jgi:arylformamidase